MENEDPRNIDTELAAWMATLPLDEVERLVRERAHRERRNVGADVLAMHGWE